MPTLDKIDRQLETGPGIIPTSTPYGQPWWQGLGTYNMHPSRQQEDGSITPPTLQSQGNGEENTKDPEASSEVGSGLNGDSNGQQQQHHDANSQMELMLTSYPYADPQYGGILTYGAPVHPHLLGYLPARMPLPLEMEEEPVYVNAKQYHGILRRRQIRAKAELEKKLVKNRKPYLHESRHQHAMRRARGSGGRFLNTKKLDGIAKSSSSGERSRSGELASGQSCSSASVHQTSNGDGTTAQRDDGESAVQEMKKQCLSNGNIDGHSLSFHYAQSTRRDPGNGHFSEDAWMANPAPQGTSSSK